MNSATKGTGAAAMLATGIVVTLGWVLDIEGLKLPETVSQAWQGALTIGLGYLIHSDGK
jgi:hypothetical protein